MNRWKVRRLIVLCGIFVSLPSGQAAEVRKIPLESTIDTVTVYPRRALVSRTASVSLTPGQYTLEQDHLPPTLLDESVQASGEGKAKILGVEVNKDYLAEGFEARSRELEEKLKGLEDKQKVLKDRLETLAHQKEFVKNIRVETADTLSKEMMVKRPDVAEWQKILIFIHGSLSEINGKIQEVEKQDEELAKQIEVVKRDLGDLRSAVGKEAKTVTVHLQVEEAGSLNLQISYLLPGASWSPAYEARAGRHDEKVHLTYYGIVNQKTGEDWNSVKLALSTARPSISGELPELSPWRLDVYEPPVSRVTGSLGGAAEMMGPGGPGSALRRERRLDQATAEVQQQQTSSAFMVSRRETIPNGTSRHRVTLALEELESEFSYVTVPKLSQSVFLEATVTHSRDFPLLPGKVSVFFGGNYVASSRIEMIAPREQFKLSLGPDERIKVKRELVKRWEEETGVVSSYQRRHEQYRITLENYKKEPQKVLVRDQVPVSQHEKIKVTSSKVEPAPVPEKDRVDHRQGIIEWQVNLRSGEKKEVEWEFFVEHPADMRITGF